MRQDDIKKIEKIIGDPEKTAAVLAVFERVEQKQKETALARQAEGIAEAKKRGVRFGRPPLQMPKNFAQIYKSYKSKMITGVFASEMLGISQKSFRKLVSQYEEEQGIAAESLG